VTAVSTLRPEHNPTNPTSVAGTDFNSPLKVMFWAIANITKRRKISDKGKTEGRLTTDIATAAVWHILLTMLLECFGFKPGVCSAVS